MPEQEKDLPYLFWLKIWMILKKIIKSLKDSGVLFGGVTERIKYETKKQEGTFHEALLAPSVTSWVQPVISSVVKGVSGRGVRRAGRGYINKNV